MPEDRDTAHVEYSMTRLEQNNFSSLLVLRPSHRVSPAASPEPVYRGSRPSREAQTDPQHMVPLFWGHPKVLQGHLGEIIQAYNLLISEDF